MKTIITIAAATALAFAANPPATFRGKVTDTMCGASHTMMKGKPDDECIRICLKGSSQYALFDGKSMIGLSDQKTPAKFAGQQVKVTGIYNEKTKTIKVASIEAEN
jgi:hypothetical protein